jgi:uncharacterized protein YdiU (UPF0061 family)
VTLNRIFEEAKKRDDYQHRTVFLQELEVRKWELAKKANQLTQILKKEEERTKSTSK